VIAVEVVLRHENGRWRARGGGVDFAHDELRGLDSLLACAFADPAGPARVHVRFDLDGLPVWIRQYQAHYCNYVLTIPPQKPQR
jgi:hypothetical protein